MSRPVYLICPGPYLECVLNGYATNEAEIRKIVWDHYTKVMCIPADELDVRVDMAKMKVNIWENGYWYGRYSIHKIERVTA